MTSEAVRADRIAISVGGLSGESNIFDIQKFW
jgi:hypothetical protein